MDVLLPELQDVLFHLVSPNQYQQYYENAEGIAEGLKSHLTRHQIDLIVINQSFVTNHHS
jgi:hypothetical protein